MSRGVSASEVAKALDLRPHREGGFFRETYRSPHSISTGFGRRSLATSILYLLTEGSPSRFHRLHFDEVWFYHAGSRAELAMLEVEGSKAQEVEQQQLAGAPQAADRIEEPSGRGFELPGGVRQPQRVPGRPEFKDRLRLHLLGPEVPQVFVPSGWWLGARVALDRPNTREAHTFGKAAEGNLQPALDREWTLVGCVVTPGFEYEDFELAEPELLLAEFPEAADIIKALT